MTAVVSPGELLKIRQWERENGIDAVTGERLCSCRTSSAKPPHTCPFASEIRGDNTTLCACCERCEHECSMDV